MGGSRLSLALVVAAAGYGTRLDCGLPKQYVPLLGIPMVQRTLTILSSCPDVDALALVVNPMDTDYCSREIASEGIGKVAVVAGGGEERAVSVRNGLQALKALGSWDLLGVHDGARPLVTCDAISRMVQTLAGDAGLDGAVLGVKSTDTIKVVDEDGIIVETPAREGLWRAQTPQIFRRQVLLEAYGVDEAGGKVPMDATDDAALVEARGGRVVLVEGSPENFKVTDRVDLRLAEQILADRRW